MSPDTRPLKRCAALVAYLDERRGGVVTLDDIVSQVPGYDDDGEAPRGDDGDLTPRTSEWEALRRRVRRDCDLVEETWDIDIVYNESEGGYTLAPPFFTPAERRALLTALPVVDIEGLSPAEPGIGIWIGDDVARVKIQVDRLFTSLHDAIAERTPVRIRYRGRERVVEPWRLGRWRSWWYLAAGDPDDDHRLRRFQLDRIDTSGTEGGLPTAGEPGAYEIPDLDDDEIFSLDPNEWGPDDPVEVTVRVRRDHHQAFAREFGTDPAAAEPDGDDLLVRLTVRHRVAFRNRILAFRTNAVVLDPPGVRAEIRAHLERTARGAAG